MATFTANGHTYNTADFVTPYGYAQIDSQTGLPRLLGLIQDVLADILGVSSNVTAAEDAATAAAEAATSLENAIEVDINAQTGTTYTLALSDIDKLVTLDNAGAITLTVPPNASVAWPVGRAVMIQQIGAGTVTVAAGAGVTVNTAGTAISARWGAATLLKTATNVWTMVGAVE